jgi:hypothetical protein
VETAAETLIGTANDDAVEPVKTRDDGIDLRSGELTSDSASIESDIVSDEALRRPWGTPDGLTKALAEPVTTEPPSLASDSKAEELPMVSVPLKRRRTKRLGIPNGTALVATLSAAATVICLISIMISLRGPIIKLMPSAMSLYRLLGFNTEPLGAGLEIRNIKTVREPNEGADILLVTGEVANVIAKPASLPTIRVSLYDTDDHELRTVTLNKAGVTLFAGEVLAFDARVTDLRAKAKHLRVGFIQSREVALP